MDRLLHFLQVVEGFAFPVKPTQSLFKITIQAKVVVQWESPCPGFHPPHCMQIKGTKEGRKEGGREGGSKEGQTWGGREKGRKKGRSDVEAHTHNSYAWEAKAGGARVCLKPAWATKQNPSSKKGYSLVIQHFLNTCKAQGSISSTAKRKET
jgi:hypothetical protein